MTAPHPGGRLRRLALVLLRASCGLLLVVWGADKLRDARHGLQVAAAFCGGLVSSPVVMTLLGAAEVPTRTSPRATRGASS